MLISEWFLGVWILNANVSERSVPSSNPPMKMKQSVPKRWHLNFRRRGTTQKKAYNIQDTAKVWNHEWKSEISHIKSNSSREGVHGTVAHTVHLSRTKTHQHNNDVTQRNSLQIIIYSPIFSGLIYENHVTESHSKTVCYNFSQSVIITWRTNELVKR
jgi:hypothetical protein